MRKRQIRTGRTVIYYSTVFCTSCHFSDWFLADIFPLYDLSALIKIQVEGPHTYFVRFNIILKSLVIACLKKNPVKLLWWELLLSLVAIFSESHGDYQHPPDQFRINLSGAFTPKGLRPQLFLQITFFQTKIAFLQNGVGDRLTQQGTSQGWQKNKTGLCPCLLPPTNK